MVLLGVKPAKRAFGGSRPIPAPLAFSAGLQAMRLAMERARQDSNL